MEAEGGELFAYACAVERESAPSLAGSCRRNLFGLARLVPTLGSLPRSSAASGSVALVRGEWPALSSPRVERGTALRGFPIRQLVVETLRSLDPWFPLRTIAPSHRSELAI